MEKEKTLAMIKPDGVSGNYSDKIKQIILDLGFSITREMKIQLDEDSVRRFYAEHSAKKFFVNLIKYMTSGPVLVMVLEKDNAVVDWRKLIGPTNAEKAKVTHPESIRAMCGFDGERNCIHGSDSVQSASREISFFFDPPKQPPQREEFNDWPHGLLTIGTFGNNNLKDQPVSSEIQAASPEQNPTTASSPDLSDFTPEEVGKLQKELTKLLKRKPAKQEEENPELPLDRFLNCPSSLEVSRRISNAVICTDPEYKEDDIEHTISVIIGKCKEVRAEKTKNAIGKKSISFLLKKMFVCANGFSPAPSLRDTLQETRMEKLLRTILHKKMYPKTSRATSLKRYLEDRHNPDNRYNEDEPEERPRSSEACKWDKTDSDFIVLEI